MGGASCTICCRACEQATIINEGATDVDVADNLAMHRDILTHHVPGIVEDFKVDRKAEVKYQYLTRAPQLNSTSTPHLPGFNLFIFCWKCKT